MEMPKPTEHHRRLEAFVGSWRGEEKLSPTEWDPVGGTAVGTFRYRLDLDGFFLLSDYTQSRGATPNFRGHGVYGWDDQAQHYTMYWFDSMGGSGPVNIPKGRWEGNALIFEGSMQAPGWASRYVHRLEDGLYHFRLELTRDGSEWKTMLEGHYTRER